MSDEMAQKTGKVLCEAIQHPSSSLHDDKEKSRQDHALSFPSGDHGETFQYHTTDALSSGRQGCDAEKNLGKTIPALTSVIVLVLLCNIGILCSKVLIFRERDNHKFALVNGDRVRQCPEKEYDGNCFEVTDTQNHVIYRNDNERRILNFFRCSSSAPETEHDKCLGEYAFSHNSSIVWYHRLYYDEKNNKHSLIVGPENIQKDGKTTLPKIRHMLQSPFNWIISHEDIPADEFPSHQLYVRGKVLVDSCV